MSLQKIEDVKAPQVGKYYLVPCILHPIYKPATFLPVIGPWHEDAEIIEFELHHFHYDWRFMPKNTLCRQAIEYSHAKVATRGRVSMTQAEAFPLFVKRRKMLRPMIEFPHRQSMHNNKAVDWIERLENKFKDHVLACRVCPHRGMPLDGLPIDAQGRVVCNGHGLRWNLNTGRISPRNDP